MWCVHLCWDTPIQATYSIRTRVKIGSTGIGWGFNIFLSTQIFFFSKKAQEGFDFNEMSIVYAVDVVVKQCSQLLNRVRMLYKIQRLYSFHCWCNRNAVDFKKKHWTLPGLQPEGVKKSTHAKRVEVKLAFCTPWWHMAMGKWRCNFT